jgi:predicted ATPase
MAKIKLKSIKFTQIPFRKLGNMTIEFADRLNVIAGHNGIGKSTIMALVANSSGLSTKAKYRSFFGKTFQGNLFDIVHIDYQAEYARPKAEGKPFPEPEVHYLINDVDKLTKKCSMTGRTESQKARVVPRTDPHATFSSTDGSIVLGPDAKVPLPTIYLGMTRMLPVGESKPENVIAAVDGTMDPNDRDYISSFINNVIVGAASKPAQITLQSIKYTGKLSMHPQYKHDSRCVSLGQDSLSSIATAVASFKKLKREWADYPGGMLVIDEVDGGFHPHAQARLVAELKKAAREFDLQIIATTHSTRVIEAVHPDGDGNANAPDAVVYLMDTAKPTLAAGFSLQNILDDMNLKAPTPAKKTKKDLKVYFEDDEAAFVFSKIFPAAAKRKLNKALGAKLNPMPLGVGGTNLIALNKRDKYFDRVVIVVDADSPIQGRPSRVAHVARLPGGKSADGDYLSPERTIHAYLEALVEDPENHESAWATLHDVHVTSDQLKEHLLDGTWNMSKRESAKAWWKQKFDHLANWKIVELWAAQHPEKVARFTAAFEKAAAVVAARL